MTCTDRDCGNNPTRKVNPRDYDSASGFLCDRCADAENTKAPEFCPVCGDYASEHSAPCVEETEEIAAPAKVAA